MNVTCRASICILLCFSFPLSARAEGLGSALLGGGWWLDMRIRTELADQEDLPRTASAHTLRSRAGYATGVYQGLAALVEFEHVFHLGPERFNNGNKPASHYPLVPDPDTAELNQAALRYDGPWGVSAILGRQRIVYDNERFIGDAGFRQNMQTFDAVALISRALPKTELRYTYIDRANRAFGRESAFGDWEMEGHAASAAWLGWSAGKLSGYGYFFDIDERPDLSSRTYGARWDARGPEVAGGWKLAYVLEAAIQSDYGGRQGNFDKGYYLLQPSLAKGPFTLTAAYEVLEGDGRNAFTTPLATLHKFQGFTDVLDIPPPGGVRDLMADINYQSAHVRPFDVIRIWGGAHHFSSDDGGGKYGQEYYAALGLTFRGVYGEIKAAAYRADGFGADTRKLWISLAKKI